MTTGMVATGTTTTQSAGDKDPVAEAKKRLADAESTEKKAQTELGVAEGLAKAADKEVQKLTAQSNEVGAQLTKAKKVDEELEKRLGWFETLKRFASADASIKALDLALVVAMAEYGDDSLPAKEAAKRLADEKIKLGYDEVADEAAKAREELDKNEKEREKEKTKAELLKKIAELQGKADKKSEEKKVNQAKGDAIGKEITDIEAEIKKLEDQIPK